MYLPHQLSQNNYYLYGIMIINLKFTFFGELILFFVLFFVYFVLIVSFIYYLTSSAIALGEIASLDHEVFDDAVEFTAFVSFSLRFLCEFCKVLGGFWYGLSEKSDYNSSGLFSSYFNIEPYLHKKILTEIFDDSNIFFTNISVLMNIKIFSYFCF